ncbi:hypothetical protein CK203_102244 [Vitis vinifera]|uniref:Uncharacterized protein n=1 Tax=Vitis vinifera TaxID=29760 RepID=A0A438D353_VITVI|nr:hypothetical protein CK203_102244 [Vitis vinifera]
MSSSTDQIFVHSLDRPSWVKVEGRLVRYSERSSMDQQSKPLVVQNETLHDSLPPPPPPPIPAVLRLTLCITWHSEVAPPAVVPTIVTYDAHARMDYIEQRMRQLRVSDGFAVWDDLEGMPVASLLAKFRMSDIERFWFVGLALYDVEDDISRGLWTDSSPSDVKGKKPFGGQRPIDVSTIGSSSQRPSRRHFPVPQLPRLTLHIHSARLIPRPRAQRASAPFALRTHKSFSQLGMPLSQALRKLNRGQVIDCSHSQAATSADSTSVQDGSALCIHQGPGHETNCCNRFEACIQDLIDQGLVHLEPIMSDGIYEMDRRPLGPRMPFHSGLVPEMASSRVLRQPPPAAARPVEGTSAPEEVRVEDDGILRQLQSTQARISTWSLLASSSTHRDALIRALSQIRVETTTTPEGPLSPICLLDNGSALNVCPLATAIALAMHFPILVPPLRPFEHTTVHGGRSWHIGCRATNCPATFVTGVLGANLGDRGFCRDFMAMSFDQHSSTVVLDMMRGMSYLPGIDLGRRQHGPSEFMAFRITMYHSGSDLFHQGRLSIYGVIAQGEGEARLTHTPFDYPVRPYALSLIGYFVRALEPQTPSDAGTFAKIGYIVDGVVPHDEYVDEMLAMSLRQIEKIAPLELVSPFDLFGVPIIEITEEIKVTPTPEIAEDVIVVGGLFDGPVGLVEEESDFVDPPLSLDVLSGFVSRHDYVSDSSSMDLSIFEYFPVSYDID